MSAWLRPIPFSVVPSWTELAVEVVDVPAQLTAVDSSDVLGRQVLLKFPYEKKNSTSLIGTVLAFFRIEAVSFSKMICLDGQLDDAPGNVAPVVVAHVDSVPVLFSAQYASIGFELPAVVQPKTLFHVSLGVPPALYVSFQTSLSSPVVMLAAPIWLMHFAASVDVPLYSGQ